jgi:hypothetical protein
MKFSIPSKDGSSSGMNTSRQLKDPNPNRRVFAPQHMQLTTTRDGSEGPHGMMTLDETITTSITMSHVLRKLPEGRPKRPPHRCRKGQAMRAMR